MQNSQGGSEIVLFQDQGHLGGSGQRIESANMRMLRGGATTMMGLQSVVHIVHWKCPEGCGLNNDTFICIFLKFILLERE